MFKVYLSGFGERIAEREDVDFFGGLCRQWSVRHSEPAGIINHYVAAEFIDRRMDPEAIVLWMSVLKDRVSDHGIAAEAQVEHA